MRASRAPLVLGRKPRNANGVVTKPATVSALSTDGLIEAIETEDGQLLGVQFHPEFTSTPRDSHPLFLAYVKAALAHKLAKAL